MPAELIKQGSEDSVLLYVVDDEEMMLKLAELALHRDGYRIRKFMDPNAALEAFSQEADKPSLLLTDFAMSPIDGLELSARCKLAWPQLKVLLVSGTGGPEILQGRPAAVDQFLQKPYEPAELSRQVRALLRPK